MQRATAFRVEDREVNNETFSSDTKYAPNDEGELPLAIVCAARAAPARFAHVFREWSEYGARCPTHGADASYIVHEREVYTLIVAPASNERAETLAVLAGLRRYLLRDGVVGARRSIGSEREGAPPRAAAAYQFSHSVPLIGL
jgi:hypothetical protein